MTVDVHQHLWPAELVDALRARRRPPYLRDWTLHTAHEAPYDVDATDHEVAARAARERDADCVLVSLSAPLGIETLPPEDAQPLLDAWHEGAAVLPAPFAAWASVRAVEPETDTLKGLLTGGFAGLQLPAAAFADPAAVEAVAPLLELCAALDRPVLIHPGPASAHAGPAWWAAVVDYPAQLQAAWWAWHVAGRPVASALRVCFAAGAGLAPLHHERFTARGGGRFVVDPDVYVDTSSYRRQGIDALTRALGIDAVVLGSDRPYAEPAGVPELAADLGAAAARAITETNPRRLLQGGRAVSPPHALAAHRTLPDSADGWT